jgi:hypothetical protein
MSQGVSPAASIQMKDVIPSKPNAKETEASPTSFFLLLLLLLPHLSILMFHLASPIR